MALFPLQGRDPPLKQVVLLKQSLEAKPFQELLLSLLLFQLFPQERLPALPLVLEQPLIRGRLQDQGPQVVPIHGPPQSQERLVDRQVKRIRPLSLLVQV